MSEGCEKRRVAPSWCEWWMHLYVGPSALGVWDVGDLGRCPRLVCVGPLALGAWGVALGCDGSGRWPLVRGVLVNWGVTAGLKRRRFKMEVEFGRWMCEWVRWEEEVPGAKARLCLGDVLPGLKSRPISGAKATALGVRARDVISLIRGLLV